MTLEPDARSVRLAHLRTESEIHSVGQLCYLVGFLGSLGTLEFVLFATGVLAWPPEIKAAAPVEVLRVGAWILSGSLLLNTVAQVALGYGLVRLQAWARWTVVALTGLSLASGLGLGLGYCFVDPIRGSLASAVGVAIHAVILVPLLGRSSGVVFSRAYREVIRQTPEIRPRMHWLLKAMIGLIFAGVASLAAYLLAIYLRFLD